MSSRQICSVYIRNPLDPFNNPKLWKRCRRLPGLPYHLATLDLDWQGRAGLPGKASDLPYRVVTIDIADRYIRRFGGYIEECLTDVADSEEFLHDPHGNPIATVLVGFEEEKSGELLIYFPPWLLPCRSITPDVVWRYIRRFGGYTEGDFTGYTGTPFEDFELFLNNRHGNPIAIVGISDDIVLPDRCVTRDVVDRYIQRFGGYICGIHDNKIDGVLDGTDRHFLHDLYGNPIAILMSDSDRKDAESWHSIPF